MTLDDWVAAEFDDYERDRTRTATCSECGATLRGDDDD